MGTVPSCHGDSAGRVMLSHVVGLSRSLFGRREICKAQDVIKLSPFLLQYEHLQKRRVYGFTVVQQFYSIEQLMFFLDVRNSEGLG